MNMVHPIRDKKQIEVVKSYLKSKSVRDYLMFQVGISSALRISDILRLQIKHIWNNRKPVDFIEINEKKTSKYKRFPVTPNLAKAIKEYAAEYDMSDPEAFVFRSRKGSTKAITRQQAVTILNHACDMCGVSEKFGTHGMRKTWGYFAFKNGISLDYISIALKVR
ncbi:tyrosine-type recombinase/integrase [Cohnella thermotolerans]|uniref:tyrosine-type recombinase/integrase n=1 Tax=Cohnella thermotolerans TaxID=329858 RepID=UPI0006860137|nr:tyrosine-type recombinase/integrase [Cohnella thermotolerans]